jgi:hypothetical protein
MELQDRVGHLLSSHLDIPYPTLADPPDFGHLLSHITFASFFKYQHNTYIPPMGHEPRYW